MHKHLKPAVFIFTAITTLLQVTAQAKEQNDKATPNIASTKGISALISDAKQRIEKCEGQYNLFLTTSRAAELAWEAEYDADRASERLSGKKIAPPLLTKTTPYHKICAEAEKQQFIPVAKNFIKLQKKADSQKHTKNMVAQWITSIDAIGNEGAKAEKAKFETLANGLMLDI